MLKHWIMILMFTWSAVGCTAQAQRREKVARARSEALERDLKASEEARKKAESKSAAMQTSLDETNKKLTENKDLLRSLELALRAREDDVARLTLAEGAERVESVSADELKAKLAAAIKARDEAKRDLAAAREKEKNIQSSLDQQKNRMLQVFLENASPDTLFVADASDMANYFEVEGRECAIIMDIARDVEVLRGPSMPNLPRLEGLDVLPMRVPYTKVLVCRTGGALQVGRETGFLYRTMSRDNLDERKLVSGRNQGMCDNRPEAMAKASAFGEVKYQVLGSFRGEVDGIETLDLPRSGEGSLRLNTASAVVSASSCAETRDVAGDNSVTLLACKVVLGDSLSGVSRVDGCFTEQKNGDGMALNFNP